MKLQHPDTGKEFKPDESMDGPSFAIIPQTPSHRNSDVSQQLPFPGNVSTIAEEVQLQRPGREDDTSLFGSSVVSASLIRKQLNVILSDDDGDMEQQTECDIDNDLRDPAESQSDVKSLIQKLNKKKGNRIPLNAKVNLG